jgi:hypothetical protein
LFSRLVSDPPDVVAARKLGPSEPFLMSTKMPSGRTNTGNTSMGRHVSRGVSRRKTGFSGYHALISPVFRSKVDAGAGAHDAPVLRQARVREALAERTLRGRAALDAHDGVLVPEDEDALAERIHLLAVAAGQILERADLAEALGGGLEGRGRGRRLRGSLRGLVRRAHGEALAAARGEADAARGLRRGDRHRERGARGRARRARAAAHGGARRRGGGQGGDGHL